MQTQLPFLLVADNVVIGIAPKHNRKPMYENDICRTAGLIATCNDCNRIIFEDENWLVQYTSNGGYCKGCDTLEESTVQEAGEPYRTTTQEHLSKLPPYCFSVLLIDKSLIRINAGESGYYKQRGYETLLWPNKTIDQLANEMNAEMKVTIQQRRAMDWGSQFGWEVPAADPDNYDETGRPYSSNNPRPSSSVVNEPDEVYGIRHMVERRRTAWEISKVHVYLGKDYTAILGPHSATGHLSHLTMGSYMNYCNTEITVHIIEGNIYLNVCTRYNDHVCTSGCQFPYKPNEYITGVRKEHLQIVHGLIAELVCNMQAAKSLSVV